MKIILCGSMSAHKKMIEVKNSLVEMGYDVDMPTLDNLDHELDEDGNTVETAEIKIKKDIIRSYFHKIKESDAVLAVNEDKKKCEGLYWRKHIS